MSRYPRSLVETGHVAPVPRRIRAVRGHQTMIDTEAAWYVWEWPHYPQYYVPVRDVAPDALEGPGVAHERVIDGVPTVRFEWAAFDHWFEEDEEVFVHPRDPYARVDAIRSSRRVRVELDGVVLAESPSPVMVFETGLPTRYYLNPTEVRFEYLRPSSTVTACPYKGKTTGYWAAEVNGVATPDVAWTYHFPTLALQPIAGLIAFYNERVDLVVGGQRLTRPVTHFS